MARILFALASLAVCALGPRATHAQLSPTQFNGLVQAIRAVNRCRIVEAKKIDDGRSPVAEVATKIRASCRSEADAFRKQLAGTSMAGAAGDIDGPGALQAAVKQERAPEKNILAPR
jgi:hypothetical protein